jgi:hypothetical protein
VFGLSQAGLLGKLRIGDAPYWLGVIIPLGIATGIRSMPSAQRLPWALIALGWLGGVGARAFGFETTSIMVLLGSGTVALVYTVWHRAEIAMTDRPLARRTVWTAVLLLLLTIAILLWPPL